MKFKLLIVFSLMLIFALLHSQDLEDFETSDFTSFYWEFAGDSNWSVTTYAPFAGNFCAQAGNIDDNETSILQATVETAVDGDISFQWKVSSQTDEDLLVFYIDNAYYGIISGEQDWIEFTEPLEAGIHTLRWKYQKDNNTDEFLDSAWIDNISFPTLTDFEHNIGSVDIIGNQIVYAEDSGVYEIDIKNFGNVAENNYTIDLYREGNILLESRVIDDVLAPGENRTHSMVWFIPEDEEPTYTYVYGKVTMAGDEFSDDNGTGLFGVEILPAGLVEIQIGNGDELNNWCPMAFRFANSITQTLYFSQEIGISGEVIAVGYTNNFQNNLLNKATRIWMAMTAAPSLEGGWVNPGQMTEVFNGNINYPSGQNRIVIQFQETVMYDGINNLAIHVNRPFDTDTGGYFDEFMSTHSTPGFPDRTRSISSDQNMNPTAPPEGFVFNRLPNTSLFILADGLGGITGVVRDDSGIPVIEADLIIEGPGKTTKSNGIGEYVMGNVGQAVYDVTASKFGYEPHSQSVTILEDQVVEVDFTLEPLDAITLSGTVVPSDNPDVGLEGAYVMLSGYGDYIVQTDENGDFSIPGVYADQDYHLSIDYPGYDQYSYYFTTMGFDLYLGILELSEIAYPVRDVFAVEILDDEDEEIEVQLDWIAPISFRNLESYKIHRFLEDDIDNPEDWDLIAEAITDTTYLDEDWAQLIGDIYQYGITAVYTNGVFADPAFSDVVVKNTGSDDDSVPEFNNVLSANFPNPFNPTTTISYQLAEKGNVSIEIYNTKGQLVETLVDGEKTSGQHKAVWNAEIQSSGIYFYKITTDDFTDSKKMILLK